MRNTLTLLAFGFLISASAWGATCPAIGNSATCDEVITISATGTVSIVVNGTAYDGVEDQLIGVVDNWAGHTVSNLGLTGTAIFGFDGDGANSATCVSVVTNPFGCHPQANPDDVAHGNTGYAGFTSNSTDDYFTNYVLGGNTGTVNFVGGLQAGQTAWFSLEFPAQTSGLGVTVNVPEPSSILLFGTLLGLAATKLRRRRVS
jgi:hypothetical protein